MVVLVVIRGSLVAANLRQQLWLTYLPADVTSLEPRHGPVPRRMATFQLFLNQLRSFTRVSYVFTV